MSNDNTTLTDALLTVERARVADRWPGETTIAIGDDGMEARFIPQDNDPYVDLNVKLGGDGLEVAAGLSAFDLRRISALATAHAERLEALAEGEEASG